MKDLFGAKSSPESGSFSKESLKALQKPTAMNLGEDPLDQQGPLFGMSAASIDAHSTGKQSLSKGFRSNIFFWRQREFEFSMWATRILKDFCQLVYSE